MLGSLPFQSMRISNAPPCIRFAAVREEGEMKRNSIERAVEWRDANRRNYAVYEWFLNRARQYAKDGEKFSVKFLVEEYRWLTKSLADKQDNFKWDNSLTTPLARLLIADDPEIADYITVKKAYCDSEELCAS